MDQSFMKEWKVSLPYILMAYLFAVLFLLRNTVIVNTPYKIGLSFNLLFLIIHDNPFHH